MFEGRNDSRALKCRFRVLYGPRVRRSNEPNHYSASVKDGPDLPLIGCPIAASQLPRSRPSMRVRNPELHVLTVYGRNGLSLGALPGPVLTLRDKLKPAPCSLMASTMSRRSRKERARWSYFVHCGGAGFPLRDRTHHRAFSPHLQICPLGLFAL